MRRAKPPQKTRKSRRYHPVDLEPIELAGDENPDWLVGAN